MLPVGILTVAFENLNFKQKSNFGHNKIFLVMTHFRIYKGKVGNSDWQSQSDSISMYVLLQRKCHRIIDVDAGFHEV